MPMLPSDKKRLTILLGVGGGLLAAVLGAKLLMGDDAPAEDPATTSAAASSRSVGSESDAASGTASSSSSTSEFSELDFEQARNPFAQPLDPTSGPGAPIDGSSSSIPYVAGPTSIPRDGTSSSTSELPNFQPAQATSISYIEYVVGPPESAQLQVGDTLVSAVPGDIVGDRFTLVSLDGKCATLRNGDVPFSICVGQALLK
ncbi:MAG: hypothetical protein WBD02_04405 [Acidimicrobiia bacterium]